MINRLTACGLACLPILAAWLSAARADDEAVATISNGTVAVGIDRDKGGAITWLSWRASPRNAVNVADPGRLIQQSYYAGRSRDRTAEGQAVAWSPWPWNPIQGGGVRSWARAMTIDLSVDSLACETVPKLWDMPDEEAAAVMRQWTSFEPGVANAVTVRCEFESRRQSGDAWGAAVPRDQELPACYFTRRFSNFKSYLGDGTWRDETQAPGPPWGRTAPPRKALACFDATGQGIAVFSPVTTGDWNFGPHGDGDSADPEAGPCVHIAPLATATFEPRALLRYRYWLVVGSEHELAAGLDALWAAHADERLDLGQAAQE